MYKFYEFFFYYFTSCITYKAFYLTSCITYKAFLKIYKRNNNLFSLILNVLLLYNVKWKL